MHISVPGIDLVPQKFSRLVARPLGITRTALVSPFTGLDWRSKKTAFLAHRHGKPVLCISGERLWGKT
jgi:hypothetical protein